MKLSLPNVVDICQDILKNKYFDFLLNEYGRDINKIKHSTSLMLLWKSNFSHIITTNFDPSLYDNIENCEKLRTYPSGDLEINKERTLYHLHGRAFIVPGETNDTLNYYLKHIIYGKQSYYDAYDDKNGNGLIDSFIFSLIKKYTIFFVGYSMNDDDFSAAYGKLKRKWDLSLSKINEHPQKPFITPIEHYILLPYPRKDNEMKPTDYETEKKKFELKEKILLDINIKTIAYKEEEFDTHIGVLKSLEYILDKAPFASLNILTELSTETFDSSSASTNEVNR
jgi:SIR2-like domain